VDGIQAPGYHAAIWNGTNSAGEKVASGVYLYKLEAVGSNGATFVQTKKLLLLK
jgi:flagellar hook assembly protein FlgD